jgi:hypothetical protein
LSVTILDMRILTDDEGVPDRQGALLEIEDGGPIYTLQHGNIPLGLTREQAKAWLEDSTRFDTLYALAEKHNEVAGDLIDNPHLDIQRVLKALGLVLRDRDEYIINHINALANYLGVPQVNRPEPVTPQQVYDAVRARYLELE